MYYSQDHVEQNNLLDYFKQEDLPYRVCGVVSQPDARNTLSSTPIDLLLIEEEDGRTFLADLPEGAEDIPWIVLTRDSDGRVPAQAFRSGASDCICIETSPDYLPKLSASIAKTLTRSLKEKESRAYQKHLEEIVAERTHVLIESNQRLTEETLQRAQALKDLKESREIYRKFFHTSRDAVFIINEDGRWIDMNQSTLDLFGYQSLEQIWNDSFLDLYWDSEDLTGFLTKIKEEGSLKNFPFKFKKKDGSKVESLVSATTYEVDGKVVGFQGLIQDITEDVRAKDEKKESLRQQRIIDDLAVAIGTSPDVEQIYQNIAEHVSQLFNVDCLNIYKFEAESQQVNLEYMLAGKIGQATCKNYLSRFDSIPSAVQEELLSSKVSLKVDNASDFLEGTHQEQDEWSGLFAPVVAEGQVIGVIQVLNRQPNFFTEVDLALLTRITNVVAIGLKKTYLFQESQSLVNKLSSLQRMEQAVLENLSIGTTLDSLMDGLVRELNVDAADILYYHPKLKTLKFITQTGFKQNILQHTDIEIGEGLAGQACESQQLVKVLDLGRTEQSIVRSLEFSTEKFVSYFGVPLLAKHRLVGVLEIFQRERFEPDQEWIDLLEMIGGLAALAIDHQNLYQDLTRSRVNISNAFDAIIEGWAQALELRGIEAKGHWRRVEDLSLRLAEGVGLKGTDLIDLRRGALLHDIGKMGIPDEILLKGGKLTKEERKVIGRHPLDAFELLQPIEGLQTALDIPLYHHERWDGEGYPYGIAGEDIPLPARIFAVVDVWDALLTDRPYRKAFTMAEALLHMRKQSGKHFDPAILKVFLDIQEERLREEQGEGLLKEQDQLAELLTNEAIQNKPAAHPN